MELIYYSDTLTHHGIKGQKWGRRRYQNSDGSLTPMGRERYGVSEAKVDYKKAKKEYKKDMKSMRRDIRQLEGATGLNVNRLVENRDAIRARRNENLKAYTNMIEKKAAYKMATKSTDEAKAKAEKRVYTNAMVGMRDSYNDVQSGGRASALYDSIKTKKGKEYADSVEKRLGHRAVSVLAASTAVSVGAAITAAILEARN